MIDPAALSPEKRLRILRGAATVFFRDGYEGASMSRIAREADVSKGTLYNYFDSKASLFTAHVEAACRRYMGEIFERLGDQVEIEPALREIGERMVCMMLSPERRGIYRMVISEAAGFPQLACAFYLAGPSQATSMLSAWLAARTADGSLAVEDAGFAAEQFFALCQTRLSLRYRLHLQAEPTPAEIAHVVDGAVRMFLSRYRPAPPNE